MEVRTASRPSFMPDSSQEGTDGQFLWLTRTEVCQETEGLVQGRRKNKASHGKETRHSAWHHCYLCCCCCDSQLLLYVCNCMIVLSLRIQLQMNHYVHEQLTLFPTLSNTSIWKYCNMQLGMKNHSHLGTYVKLHKHHHPGLCTGNQPWECTQNDRILDVCMCVGHLLVPRDLERWQEGATDLSVPLYSKSWVLVCMHNLSSDFIFTHQ